MDRPVLAALHKIEFRIATVLKTVIGNYHVWRPALWNI
jgi:hypothetical protein